MGAAYYGLDEIKGVGVSQPPQYLLTAFIVYNHYCPMLKLNMRVYTRCYCDVLIWYLTLEVGVTL